MPTTVRRFAKEMRRIDELEPSRAEPSRARAGRLIAARRAASLGPSFRYKLDPGAGGQPALHREQGLLVGEDELFQRIRLEIHCRQLVDRHPVELVAATRRISELLPGPGVLVQLT